ncbi:hypothetical protein F5887DRAFT_1078229 [Amanita rubescens]|nr:hypothetical protein F5887DRAFT_1078229 [Amanita rubescens]
MEGEVNAQGQRRCTCSKRCRGDKWVSYKTYLAHAPYRDVDKDVRFSEFVSQFGTVDNPTHPRTRQKSIPRSGVSPQLLRNNINVSGSPEPSGGLSAPLQPPLPDLDTLPNPSGPLQSGCNASGSETSEDPSRDFGAPVESDLDVPPGTLNGIFESSAAGSLPDIGDRGVWQYGPHGDQSQEDEAGEGEQDIDNEMDLDEGDRNTLVQEDSDNENFHSTFTDCPRSSHIKLALSQEFIASIRNAQFSDDMDPEMISALKNPSRTPPDIDEKTRMSIDIYLGLSNASEESYRNTKKALARRNPPVEIHSLHIVKKKICDMTGVKTIDTDMCINSCLAYTGPFSSLQACTQCGEPRYEDSTSQKRVARQRFCTIPLGPQLQAMYRSPDGADRMHYRARKTREILEQLAKDNDEIPVYEDVYHGEDYLEAVGRGDIGENDIVCMFSLDGAQLYRDNGAAQSRFTSRDFLLWKVSKFSSFIVPPC